MKKLRVPLIILLAIACALVVYQCSTIQGENREKKKKIMAFLDRFEKNLQQTDEVILKQFHVEKSAEVVMKSVRIMQNKDKGTDSVECVIDFKVADVSFESSGMRVEVPALHRSFGDSTKLQEQTKFTLWLEPDDGELVISKFEGDQFYNRYQNLAHQLRFKKIRVKELASKKIFFDQARMLQQKFDTVIWYSRIKDSTYYYVVNGKWENYFFGNSEQVNACNMGLVSETGRVIVPPSYDLVGTIGFTIPEAIEVRKNNRIGLFHLSGRELVPAQYDWIIPYSSKDAFALVKQDSTFGWLDVTYAYHAGFPDAESEKYVRKFGYLSNNINIDANNTMTYVLHPDHIGWGMVMPSAYLVSAGVTHAIVDGINTGAGSMMGWGGTEYVRTEGASFESITDKISALVVSMKERYLEGRQEFYKHNALTFVDNQNRPIAKFTLAPGTFSFHKIDSSLLEMRSHYPYGDGEIMVEYEGELDMPYYTYFRLGDKGIEKLEPEREYSFTRYVKMDSTYIYGKFTYWDKESGEEKIINRLSNETLAKIRNEILAWYGFEFGDSGIGENFKYRKWYIPRYFHYNSFIDKMTPIDRHNLEYLESFIGTLDKPAS